MDKIFNYIIERLEIGLYVTLFSFGIYLAFSMTVFRMRHRWMTETELFFHVEDALKWDRLKYSEVRPRE